MREDCFDGSPKRVGRSGRAAITAANTPKPRAERTAVDGRPDVL